MQSLPFDLNAEIDKAFSGQINNDLPKITVSRLSDAVFSLANNGDLSIILNANDFLKYNKKIMTALKFLPQYLVVRNEVEDLKKIKKLTLKNKILVIGNEDFLIKIANVLKLRNLTCSVLLTSPNVNYILSKKAKIKGNNPTITVNISCIENIFIDENIIYSNDDSVFADCYIKTLSNYITLIDYKVRNLLLNKQNDVKFYNLLKESIDKTIYYFKYSNKKGVLFFSRLLVCLVRAKSNLLEDNVCELACDLLNVFCSDILEGQRYLIVLNKLTNLYHFYFNNDFSNDLLSCNYNKDIENLSKTTNISKRFFIERLKIPTVKRQKLINKLKSKIFKAFLSETFLLIKLNEVIKQTYLKLSKVDNNYILNKEQVKNALSYSTYFTSSPSVLTLIRDCGLLSLENNFK